MACPIPPVAPGVSRSAGRTSVWVMCPPLRPSCGRAVATACLRVAAQLLPALLEPHPLPRTRDPAHVLALRRAYCPVAAAAPPPPPPPNRQTPLNPPPPPQHLGMPLVVAAAEVPHPPGPFARLAGALCWSHDVCIGHHGCPVRLRSTRCALFYGGEGGRSCLGCPGTAHGGEGWYSSTCATEVAALPPARCSPRNGGGGRPMSPAPAPPPLAWGPRPGGGGGGLPSHVDDDPARAAVSRQEMSPKVSASPREGGGGGMRTGLLPPPRVFVRPGALPALVTPTAVPRVPPLALRFPLGGAGRAGRAA